MRVYVLLMTAEHLNNEGQQAERYSHIVLVAVLDEDNVEEDDDDGGTTVVQCVLGGQRPLMCVAMDERTNNRRLIR